MDASRASLSAAAHSGEARGPLAVTQGETVRLHIFLDRSVVEVFANEQTCITERIYPTRLDSLGIALFARGGPARLTALDVWDHGGDLAGERSYHAAWRVSLPLSLFAALRVSPLGI